MNEIINYEQTLKNLLKLIEDEKIKFKEYVNVKNKELQEEKNKLKEHIGEKNKELQKKEHELDFLNKWLIQMFIERQRWFPRLANAYADLLKIHDNVLELTLINKKNSAVKASDVLKEQNKLKRKIIKENKQLEYILSYYESIAPFLIELKEEILDDNVNDDYIDFSWYTEEELQDEITNYLTIDEYRKLSSIEKNKLAFERYKKRPKSKVIIWKIYEQYVWQIYESLWYDVEYVWIFKWLEDLWRDLICKKWNEIIVIQCKNWSKFKTIYEKHVFQFFWTVFQYREENKTRNVKSIFYSSTWLSELALKFANELWIEIKENFKFNIDYPCIKCNISNVTKEKIYHLPFDQQYDKIKINIKDWDSYCTTIEEAESKWFRRAYRYNFKK